MSGPETISSAEYNARHKPRAKGKKTGPDGDLSSPSPEPDAPETPQAEYARRRREGHSVFLCWVYEGDERSVRCVGPDELLDLFARAVRASSHRVIIELPE